MRNVGCLEGVLLVQSLAALNDTGQIPQDSSVEVSSNIDHRPPLILKLDPNIILLAPKLIIQSPLLNCLSEVVAVVTRRHSEDKLFFDERVLFAFGGFRVVAISGRVDEFRPGWRCGSSQENLCWLFFDFGGWRSGCNPAEFDCWSRVRSCGWGPTSRSWQWGWDVGRRRVNGGGGRGSVGVRVN